MLPQPAARGCSRNSCQKSKLSSVHPVRAHDARRQAVAVARVATPTETLVVLGRQPGASLPLDAASPHRHLIASGDLLIQPQHLPADDSHPQTPWLPSPELVIVDHDPGNGTHNLAEHLEPSARHVPASLSVAAAADIEALAPAVHSTRAAQLADTQEWEQELELEQDLDAAAAEAEASIVSRQWQQLREELRLDTTSFDALCAQLPSEAKSSPQALAQRLHSLAGWLGCTELHEISPCCTRMPVLLSLPQGRMHERFTYLRQELQLSSPEARFLLKRCPQLATLAHSTLQVKVEGLAGILGLPLPAAAKLLVRTPLLLEYQTATLQAHHQGLLRFLTPQQVHKALLQEPGLLARSPDALEQKLRLLQQLLPCDPHQVADLVCCQPGMLRKSLPAIARCLRCISIWRMAPADKLRLLQSHPVLLVMSPPELYGRCRWLRRLMLSNGYYHSTLRRLPPRLLGVILHTLPRAWSRLQYLADSSQESRMPIMMAVECSDERFAARFPEYQRWLEWKVKQMGTDNPWRGAFRVRGIGGAPKAKLGVSGRGAAGGAGPQHPGAAGRAGAAQAAGQVVVHEAQTIRVGGYEMIKPKRVVVQPLPPPQPLPQPLPAPTWGPTNPQQQEESPAPAPPASSESVTPHVNGVAVVAATVGAAAAGLAFAAGRVTGPSANQLQQLSANGAPGGRGRTSGSGGRHNGGRREWPQHSAAGTTAAGAVAGPQPSPGTEGGSRAAAGEPAALAVHGRPRPEALEAAAAAVSSSCAGVQGRGRSWAAESRQQQQPERWTRHQDLRPPAQSTAVNGSSTAAELPAAAAAAATPQRERVRPARRRRGTAASPAQPRGAAGSPVQPRAGGNAPPRNGEPAEAASAPPGIAASTQPAAPSAPGGAVL